jgi:signal peptidase II
MRGGRTALSAGIAGTVVLLDLLTKRWALAALSDGTTFELFGGFVPITLAFNRGAAFGLSIGSDPRWIFIPVTLLAIAFLVALIREAQPGDFGRVTAASLVLGGALGNLYDRIRWNRGVVDFIGPIDLGFMDWPVFNAADAAITCGAILLAISFWREGASERTAAELARAETQPEKGEAS